MRMVNKLAALVAGLGLVLGLLTGGAVPAQAATKYKVSITAVSNRTPLVGDQVSISGRLTGATSKWTVKLQRRWKGSKKWSTINIVPVDASGRFTAVDTMSANKDRYYRISKVKEGSRKAAVSKSVFVNVSAPKNSVTFTVTQAGAGPVTVSGRAATGGGTVTVRSRAAGQSTWNSSRVNVAKDATFSLSQRYAAGLREFQVDRPAVGGMKAVTSATLSIQVLAEVAITGEVKVPFGTTTVTNPDRLACTEPAVVTAGIEGVAWTMTDGTTRLVQAPVNQIVEVGTKSCSGAAPVITASSSSTGPLAGGETLTLTGTGLDSTAAVTFTPIVRADWTTSGDGWMPSVPARFEPVSATELRITIPAGIGGTATITVTSPLGAATTIYTYVATSRPPTVAEQAFLDEVNRYRTAGYDCDGEQFLQAAPLAWEGRWADISLAHSRDIIYRWDAYQELYAAGGIDALHGAPNIVGGWRKIVDGLDVSGAEVLTGTPIADPKAPVVAVDEIDARYAVGSLMSSLSHCRALMNPARTKMGIGAAAGTVGPSAAPVRFWTALISK